MHNVFVAQILKKAGIFIHYGILIVTQFILKRQPPKKVKTRIFKAFFGKFRRMKSESFI